MSKHQEIDNRIAYLLSQKPSTFGRLVVHMRDTEWRLIDRRLQAMKKQGRIKYLGPSLGWGIADHG